MAVHKSKNKQTTPKNKQTKGKRCHWNIAVVHQMLPQSYEGIKQISSRNPYLLFLGDFYSHSIKR